MQTVWITGKIIGLVSHSFQAARGRCENQGMGIYSLSCVGDGTVGTGQAQEMAKGTGVSAAAAGVQHSWVPRAWLHSSAPEAELAEGLVMPRRSWTSPAVLSSFHTHLQLPQEAPSPRHSSAELPVVVRSCTGKK